MALQGTLDTFALPDVLRLLASTRKTGQLSVATDRGAGTLWLAEGELTTARLGTDRELPAVDVLFELLRSDGGSFEFDTEQDGPATASHQELEPVLGEAERMLHEWHDIVAVVPSMRSQLTLAFEIDQDCVTIERDEWRQLAMIGGGSTVEALGEHLGLGELSAARAVKALVEAGLVTVGGEVAPAEPQAVVDPPFEDLAPEEPEPLTVEQAPPASEWQAAELAEPVPPPPVWVPSESFAPVPDAAEALVDEDAAGFPAEPAFASDLPEPLPGGEPLDRFAVFGASPEPGLAAPATVPPPPPLPVRQPAVPSTGPTDLPEDLVALSPDAARAVAAVMDQQGVPAANGQSAVEEAPVEGANGETSNRGLLLRLLGPNRD